MARLAFLRIAFAGALLLMAVPASSFGESPDATVSGELRQWHKVTLTLDGPESSEDATPNPFLDYRMQVTFEHQATGLTYLVPGYFAADGDSANTSATSGNKWRAHLSPDHAGEWTYLVSFREGPGSAIMDEADAGAPVDQVDGTEGSFTVSKSDKTGRDFRGKGRLKYVGKHHLQFAGSKQFFLKAGVDAPENFLAYEGFDGGFKTDGVKDSMVKTWAPHVQDWHTGDPMWQDGKGKGIIGAINYLADQGMNAFSFLTLNIEGDDCNAFPYTTYDERERMDCSRMDQWEIVFKHGSDLGMYLHFKTQECENVHLLDDGHMGPQRKLYYRELISRFGHHLALNWNLGEEVGYKSNPTSQDKIDWAEYFWTHDPYQHPIVIHNGNKHYEMLGDASELTGFSLQTNRADFGNVHGATLNYIRRSVKAGKPWVVACDEPGDASHALIPDDEDPTRDDARQNALWGNIMAGGAGIEWYFGYQHAHSDLTCEDYRVRQTMWQQSRVALDFFASHPIEFWNMTNANELVDKQNAFCLAEPGKTYLVYRKRSGNTSLDLTDASGVFEIHWFNPRTGGKLVAGTTQAVNGGAMVAIGSPTNDDGRDWLAVILPGDPSKNYPPGVSAGTNISVMMPPAGDSVTVDLLGDVSDDKNPGAKLSSLWTCINGPGKIGFSDAAAPRTQVTFKAVGKYELKLTANDGTQDAEAKLTVNVEPFQSKVTRALPATDDVYIEGTNVIGNQFLKVEGKRRVSFLKFDVKDLPPKVLDVQLRLTGGGDSGGGKLRVHLGAHSDWVGTKMTKQSAPKSGEQLAVQSVSVSPKDTVDIPLPKMLDGDGTYTLVVTLDEGGDDIWFAATGSGDGPQLLVTFEDPDERYGEFGKASEAITEDARVLMANDDFDFAVSKGFVGGYKDAARKAMAINAAKYQDKFAAAECKYVGEAGVYDLVLTTLTETDGESSYHVLVSGTEIAEVKNPESTRDYQRVNHRFNNVTLKPGDTLRVEFNSASNGKIPEGDAFAFSRGRWQSITILKQGAAMN